MSLPSRKRLTWTRIVATAACLVALATYSAFAPRSYADDFCIEGGCDCNCQAGGTYSEGACHNNQTCSCIHYDTSCSCRWVAGCN
jgi:hypothetical protein